MKKMRFFAILSMVLLPVIAMAGMHVMHEEDMDQVSSRTGITLTIGLEMEYDKIIVYDSNGFPAHSTYMGAMTGTGWLISDDMTAPDLNVTDLSIDTGYSSSTDTTVLRLDLGNANTLEGNLIIGDLVLGSSVTATTRSVGEVGIQYLQLKTGRLRLHGHVGN